MVRGSLLLIGLVWGSGALAQTPGTIFRLAPTEPLLELGRSLKLPPWLEPSREDIEASVARIEVPEDNNVLGDAEALTESAGLPARDDV